MEISSYLKNALTKIMRDKNNIFFVILLVISTIFLIISLSFKNNINDYVEEYINRNIGFRTLSVSNKKEEEDLGKSELLEIEHVEDVYSSAYSTCTVGSEFANENLNGEISLTYLPNSTTIHTLIGSQIDADDKNVAIIPKEFYPDNSVENLKLDEKYMINGEELIGKEFTIEYYTSKLEGIKIVKDEKLTKTFTVVGVYDNKEMMNLNNQIFISQFDISEIVNAKMPRSDNPGIQITQVSDYSLNIVVDSLENMEYVMKEIDKKGFLNIQVTTEIDEATVDIIENSCYVIAGISTIVIFFIIIMYIKKKIIRESVSIGILRASGYTKKNIVNQYEIEIILTCIMTYIIGVIVSIITYIILKNVVFKALAHIGFNIKLYLSDFAITFTIIVVISVIYSIYIINKKLKNSIVNLIESRE